MPDRIYTQILPFNPPANKVPKAFCWANFTGGFIALGYEPATGFNVSSCWDVAQDATYIYFTNNSNGGIYRVPRDGSAAPVKLCTVVSLGPAQGLVVDSKYIYVTDVNGNQVNRFLLNGTLDTAAFITCANTGGSPTSIRVDPTGNFFLVGSQSGNNNGWIGRVGYTGGAVTQFINTGTIGGAAFICVDSQFIFWSYGTRATKIGRANADGSAVNQALIIPPAASGGLVSDGTTLFYTIPGSNDILSAGRDGSVPNVTVLASLFNNPQGLMILS